MKPLRLVTFDVTETLLNFRVPPAEIYAQVAARYGILVHQAELNSNFKKQWRYMSSMHPNFGQGTGLGWEKWWKELVRLTFQETVKCSSIDTSVLGSIGNNLIDLFKTRKCWTTADGAHDLLEDLNKLNLPTGIISNYDERLETVLKAMELDKYFQFVITSYSAGFEKPDSRIFKMALSRLGNRTIQPHEALHIGNTPETDYLGAVKAGWNAALVHQNAKKVTEHYNEIDPKLVFETLRDLQIYITKLHE